MLTSAQRSILIQRIPPDQIFDAVSHSYEGGDSHAANGL
jgi:hypothetical protein